MITSKSDAHRRSFCLEFRLNIIPTASTDAAPMKSFWLLLVGVVVGWAASGVDWSRDAVGRDVDTITDKKVLQYDGTAPLAEGRKVALQEVSDEKGVKHVVPHEAATRLFASPSDTN